MRKYEKILLIFIVTIIFSACSSGLSSSQVELDGSAWVLTAINNDTSIKGNPPTLEFEGDRIAGNASCNTYNGSYRVKGETISLGPLTRTEMYCMDPKGIMEQEQTYFEILEAAQRFELVDDILTIYSDSEKTLTFQIRSSISVATSPLLMEQSNQGLPTSAPELIDPTQTHILP